MRGELRWEEKQYPAFCFIRYRIGILAIHITVTNAKLLCLRWCSISLLKI